MATQDQLKQYFQKRRQDHADHITAWETGTIHFDTGMDYLMEIEEELEALAHNLFEIYHSPLENHQISVLQRDRAACIKTLRYAAVCQASRIAFPPEPAPYDPSLPPSAENRPPVEQPTQHEDANQDDMNDDDTEEETPSE